MCPTNDRSFTSGGDNSSSCKQVKQREKPFSGRDNSSSRPKKTRSLSSSPASSEEESILGIVVTSGEEKYHHNMSTTPTIGHGIISVIGRRRSMEDTFAVIPNLLHITWEHHHDNKAGEEEDEHHQVSEHNKPTYDLFAVFDGHGGHKVSQKCRDRMHQIIADEVTRRGPGEVDWESVMATSFTRMDEEVTEEGGSANRSATRTVGSTALVVVVGTEVIVAANCGDCRVLLFRNGAALPLSRDHKLNREDEKERVEAAGGNVVESDDCGRVLGVLSTTRSIGDQFLKPYVISEPETQICERSPSDDFLVIATDGLWDVLENDVACDLVRKCFRGKVSKKVLEGVGENCSAAAATMLAELAIARGSRDNISVIVVQLQRFSNSSSSV